MKHFFHRMNQYLATLCGWLLVVTCMLLFIDLVSRGIGLPIQGLAVLSVFVMITVIYLGMARCEEEDENVRVELVLDRLPGKTRKYTFLFTDVVQIVVIGLFIKEMINNTYISITTYEAEAGTVQFPIGPVKVLMVIGLIFYWIQIMIKFIDRLKTESGTIESGTDTVHGVGM